MDAEAGEVVLPAGARQAAAHERGQADGRRMVGVAPEQLEQLRLRQVLRHQPILDGSSQGGVSEPRGDVPQACARAW